MTAYDLYLRALPPQRDNLAQNERSLELLYQAIALDPSFSGAYGLAAYCYQVQTVFGWLLPSDPRFREGLRLAHLAAEAGEMDSEALWMAGRTMAVLGGNPEEGRALVDRSLQLNPNSAQGWWASGMARAFMREAETAIEHLNRARRLNPLDPSGHAYWLGMTLAYLFSGDFAKGRDAVDHALAEWANSPCLRHKVALCGLLGQHDEGRRCVEQLIASYPEASIESARAQLGLQFRHDPNILELYLEGLRRSGLRERN